MSWRRSIEGRGKGEKTPREVLGVPVARASPRLSLCGPGGQSAVQGGK